MKKLNITFCSFPDFSGNAKALYEYMVKTYKDKMNYTWIVYNQDTVDRLKSKGIKAILIGSDEFKKYIPKTNVFFTTQGNLDRDKEKCKNAVYIELWHGIGPKPIGFAQKNPSQEDIEGYGNIGRIVDYFIVPSEFWKTIFGAIFKVEYNRIKDLGMPIIDYFNHSDGRNNLSKIIKNLCSLAFRNRFNKPFHSFFDSFSCSGNTCINRPFSIRNISQFHFFHNFIRLQGIIFILFICEN